MKRVRTGFNIFSIISCFFVDSILLLASSFPLRVLPVWVVQKFFLFPKIRNPYSRISKENNATTAGDF